jgi:hypothetical protein
MECPRCQGKGKWWTSARGGGCSGSYSYTKWCDLCDGVGAVVFVETRKELISCSRCQDTGQVSEPVGRTYKTGRFVLEGYKKVRCPSCDGRKSYREITIYRPKY